MRMRSSWCQWRDLGCRQDTLWFGFVGKNVLVAQRSWKEHNSRSRYPFSLSLLTPKWPMQRGQDAWSELTDQQRGTN